MVHYLDVFLGERFVGTITNLTSDHNAFTFAPEYVQDPNRPTLSLGFYDDQNRLSPPSKTPQTKLLPFFSNLLPEGHLREYLASRAHVNPTRDFPLLWLVGDDVPGAVIIRHPDGNHVPPREAEGVVSRAVEADPTVLKFSLAGVQLKFSAVRETEGGLTIPVHGKNGDWLLKMPSAVYEGVPENEYAMMTFARAVGIQVPDISLIDPTMIRNLPSGIRNDLGRALIIKRFDRVDGARIHVEDFNQIYNQYPGEKYDNVSYDNMLRDIWRVMGEEQTREFVRRLVFSVGIGNADMHLKNWSVIYADGRTPQLAPAYDFVSTVAYIDDDALALTLARTRQWSDISYDRLERFARRSGVPRGVVIEPARDMVTRMHDIWPKLRGDLDLPDRARTRIDAQFKAVPIFSGRKTTTAPAPQTDTHDEIQ